MGLSPWYVALREAGSIPGKRNNRVRRLDRAATKRSERSSRTGQQRPGGPRASASGRHGVRVPRREVVLRSVCFRAESCGVTAEHRERGIARVAAEQELEHPKVITAAR